MHRLREYVARRTYGVADSQGCVTGHKKVAPGSWDQRRDQANEIIVHVARVPQRCCARSHDLHQNETGETT